MNVNYCPQCGGEVEDKGMDEYDCEECGSVYVEAWTYGPFQHS